MNTIKSLMSVVNSYFALCGGPTNLKFLNPTHTITVLNQLHLGAVTLTSGEVHSLEPGGCAKTYFPKVEKLVRIPDFVTKT